CRPFFFQAEDGIRDLIVTGVQTCALPISWLSPAARKSSSLIIWSQLGGTLPAPLFIFLAGVSFALVTERLREKGVERHAIAKQRSEERRVGKEGSQRSLP